MDGLTYNVRVYKTYVYKGARAKTYTVRWKVNEQVRSRVFARSAQAESYRGELLAASRRGEAFNLATGEPVSWARAQLSKVSWYDFACQYVDMKWKTASAKYRRDIARALVAATPPLLVGKPPVDDVDLRSAMTNWGFNTKRRPEAPAQVSEQLRWLSANTRPLIDLTQPGLARAVLDAATSRLDGRRAAPDTVRKHRMLLGNAMDYAIELALLDTNPIRTIKWHVEAASTIGEVDRRRVVSHAQAGSLLAAVRAQKPSGPRLVALFAFMYYAALRPEEAINVRRTDLRLPPAGRTDAWGELHLTSATPYVGPNWTNDGAHRETRALKQRTEGQSRLVPIPPPLVALLRTHLAEFPDGPDDRLFYGVHGAELSSRTYARAWRAAREEVLTPQEQASPLVRRPYDLRHAAVSTWLNAGVPAPQVAEWAGHSVNVLLRVYAKCIDGQEAAAKRRIDAALAAGLATDTEPSPPQQDLP